MEPVAIGGLNNIVDAYNQDGQIIQLPPQVIVAVQGIMQKIGEDHTRTQEELVQAYKVARDAISQTHQQLLQEIKGLPLAEQKELIAIYKEVMVLAKDSQAQTFEVFATKALEMQNASIERVQNIIDMVLKAQWEAFQQSSQAAGIIQQRNLEFERAQQQIREREREIEEIARNQENARKLQEMNKVQELQLQKEAVERNMLQETFDKYIQAHANELAVAQIFIKGNHVNKKVKAIPPEIDWVNKLVKPGSVECEGVGLPPAPAAPAPRPVQQPVPRGGRGHHHHKRCSIQ